MKEVTALYNNIERNIRISAYYDLDIKIENLDISDTGNTLCFDNYSYQNNAIRELLKQRKMLAKEYLKEKNYENKNILLESFNIINDDILKILGFYNENKTI